jgi:NitT/TauT family transport system ATP-binding protein
MIEVFDLIKRYVHNGTQLTAIEHLDLIINKGEICSIIGPSGCGKTTLLYILAGIIEDYEGNIYIDKQPIKNKPANVSLILQDYGLLPWKTVWQNVVLGLEIKRLSKKEQKERGEQALHQVGLLDYKYAYPSQLSGGQKQRVAIARALSMDANILLMDEPFSALDAITREEAQETFLNLWARSGMTVVLVTHNIEEAVYLGNRIVIMSPSPGRVLHEIQNPYQGNINLRNSPEFYEMCSEIRRKLKK